MYQILYLIKVQREDKGLREGNWRLADEMV